MDARQMKREFLEYIEIEKGRENLGRCCQGESAAHARIIAASTLPC